MKMDTNEDSKLFIEMTTNIFQYGSFGMHGFALR